MKWNVNIKHIKPDDWLNMDENKVHKHLTKLIPVANNDLHLCIVIGTTNMFSSATSSVRDCGR